MQFDRAIGLHHECRAAAAREPVLVAVGLGGLVLGAICLVGAALQGATVPPEGKLLDAATFCFGVGLYTVTIAVLLPLAEYSPAARRRWRRAFLVFIVYGLVLESVQAFRGIDPRFTETGSGLDVVAGIVFGLTAALNVVLFVVLGVRFFRAGVLADRSVLRLGVRYGVVAVAISFAVGVVMSVRSGRDVGEQGNLLLSHGLGVHGIQALPIVALALVAAAPPPRTGMLHTVGIGWLAACTAALVQALLGRPPLDASFLTAVIVAGLVVWVGSAGYALVVWRRAAAD